MSKPVLSILGLPGIVLFIAALTEEGLPRPESLIIPAIIIIVLIIANGFFVAVEFALISVRPTQLEELVKDGNRSAARMLDVVASPIRLNRYIATTQLGISLASLGLGMYGEAQISQFVEPYLARLLNVEPHAALVHTLGYLIALSFLTYLHLVLGEMVPKSLALDKPTKMILFMSTPIYITDWIFVAPVYLLNGVGDLLLRILRIPPVESHARLHSPQELEMIVSESAEGGLLNEDEGDFIRNIFTFSERQAHQVMTPRRKIQAIPLDIHLPDLVKLVSTSRFSRFPVYEEDLDHIIGILHLKDLIRQQMKSKGKFDLRLLLHKAPVIPEHYSVENLLNVFKQLRLHMSIVLDEFGGTAGIVTLEDLVEEIVGEVRDEFDRKEADPLVELAPGSLEVSGQYLLEDLDEYLDLSKEETLPDVETVGGVIITKLGRPPQVGDTVLCRGDIKFTVLSVDGLAVFRARVDFPTNNSEDRIMNNEE
ncbi:MAG TPA: HlyC/CorC family transporter [Chloroflexi bacterium]|nr:HlyC/CorC family transporter [Chloroflexota bacterium]